MMEKDPSYYRVPEPEGPRSSISNNFPSPSSSSWISSVVDFFAKAEPLFGIPGPIFRIYQVGFGVVAGGYLALLGLSSTVYFGNRLLGIVFGGAGGGGSGGGYGGYDWSSSEWELLNLPLGFWALLIFTLFLALVWYSVRLTVLLPGIPDWCHHQRLARLLGPSPYVILAVLWITNYLPSALIMYLYTPRLYVTYLASLGGVFYQLGFRFLCPMEVRQWHSRDPKFTKNRPVVRYFLALLAFAIVGSQAWLTLLLFPNSFTHAPEKWWKIFLPQ